MCTNVERGPDARPSERHEDRICAPPKRHRQGSADPDLEGANVMQEVRVIRLELGDLQAWARVLLAPYKIPRALSVVGTLPRNAMGKVVKPEVARLFE